MRSLAEFQSLAVPKVAEARELIQLLMKPRNGLAWSADDRRALRLHLRQLARWLPILAIFLLPGATLLLPLLGLMLDRRQSQRGGAPVGAAEAATPEP